MLMNAVQASARQYFFIRAIWTIQREEDLRKDWAKNDAHTRLLSHILYYWVEELGSCWQLTQKIMHMLF